MLTEVSIQYNINRSCIGLKPTICPKKDAEHAFKMVAYRNDQMNSCKDSSIASAY
jgi:hypothetical protein